MTIIIKEMPEELQALVHQRQKEQGNDGTWEGTCQNDERNENFSWKESPEGQDFWNDLFHTKKDMTQHPLYPKPLVPIYEIF